VANGRNIDNNWSIFKMLTTCNSGSSEQITAGNHPVPYKERNSLHGVLTVWGWSQAKLQESPTTKTVFPPIILIISKRLLSGRRQVCHSCISISLRPEATLSRSKEWRSKTTHRTQWHAQQCLQQCNFLSFLTAS